MIIIIIRVRAGNLQGPYCFSNDSLLFFFFVPNDRIFYCLNMPQNSPNSHLAKHFIIYCRPEFPPLGGAVIKESAFWLITHILCRTFKNLIFPRSVNCAESCGIGPAHIRQPFILLHCKMLKTYFFKLLPGDFTNLYETWHTSSVDPPDKKLSKELYSDNQF